MTDQTLTVEQGLDLLTRAGAYATLRGGSKRHDHGREAGRPRARERRPEGGPDRGPAGGEGRHDHDRRPRGVRLALVHPSSVPARRTHSTPSSPARCRPLAHAASRKTTCPAWPSSSLGLLRHARFLWASARSRRRAGRPGQARPRGVEEVRDALAKSRMSPVQTNGEPESSRGRLPCCRRAAEVADGEVATRNGARNKEADEGNRR